MSSTSDWMEGWNPRTHPFLVFLVALVTVTPSMVVAGGGGNLYVSPTGTDDADCTPEDPCATIQHAVDQAAPEDTVVVRPGVYDETVHVATENVTICGTVPQGLACDLVSTQAVQSGPEIPEDAAVLTGASAPGGFVFTISAPNVTVEGLTILSGGARSGVDVNADQVTLRDNRIVSNVANAGPGIRMIGVDVTAEDVRIDGNLIQGWAINGIALWRPGGNVTDNLFVGDRVGIHLAGLADGTTIEDNAFEGTLWSIRFAGKSSGDRQQATGVEIHGNQLDAANGAPLRLEDNTAQLTVNATGNWWGAVTCAAIDARIDDQGQQNNILVAPYTGPTGTELEPDATC